MEREIPGLIHLLGREGAPVGRGLPEVPFPDLSSPAAPPPPQMLLPLNSFSSELGTMQASGQHKDWWVRSQQASGGGGGMFHRVPLPHHSAARLTEGVPIFCHGVDALVGQDLYVLPAGATVELVGPDEAAAELIRHQALLPHMLCKIR